MSGPPVSTEHISYLRREFLESSRPVDLGAEESLRPRDGSICLYRIQSVPQFDSSDNEDVRRPQRLMADVLTGLHGLRASVSFVVVGRQSSVELYLAAWDRSDPKEDNSTAPASETVGTTRIDTLLHGAYPGIAVSDGVSVGDLASSLADFSHAGLLTGSPSAAATRPLRTDSTPSSGAEVGLEIDRLIRSLYGESWAFVMTATPLRPSECRTLSEAILNEHRQVTNAERSAGTESPIAGEYERLLDTVRSKLEIGKARGTWHAIGYLLADDPEAYRRIKAAAKGIFGGDASTPDSVQVLDVDGRTDLIASLGLPAAPSPQSPGSVRYPYRYPGVVNSDELATMIHLPTHEVTGYHVRPQPKFDVTPHRSPGTDAPVRVGEIVDEGRNTGRCYALDPDSLTRHAMVVGTTGSGKTNTIFHVLRQLADRDVPFLVIEPAKTEYRQLLDTELGERLQIFTLGDELVSPFRINPFEVRPGVPVQTHIDHLKSVFNAAFVMYAPMPYVLEQCIHEVYEDRGWDLVTGENRRGRHPRAHPTLTDLYEKVGPVVDRLGYERELTHDITAALETRIDNLRIGSKGLMLDTHVSLPISSLLEAPTVLELDHVGDDDEKAFLIGLVLLSLYEHYQASGTSEADGLNHVTVIEEAHRLLKSTPDPGGRSHEAANMAGKAVESFSNILAEIRAYGEGMIVADQIPAKLARDVVKNTNLKIVHRLLAEDDRSLLAGSMAADAEQTTWFGLSDVGEAAVFGGEDDNPILVKVPYRKVDSEDDGRDLDARIHDRMAQFRDAHVEELDPYPWADLEPSVMRHHLSTARQVAEDGAFEDALARCVRSVAVSEEALSSELPVVLRTVREGTPDDADEDLLRTALVLSVDRLFETRGRQFDVPFSDLERLKATFAALLLGTLDRAGHTDDAGLDAELQEQAASFQRAVDEHFASDSCPCTRYDGVTPEGRCRYRYDVEALVRDGQLYDRFADALAASSGPELWMRAAEVSRDAADQLLAESVPPEERRTAALCFAIQAAEVMATIDERLQEKLVDGLRSQFEGTTETE